MNRACLIVLMIACSARADALDRGLQHGRALLMRMPSMT